MYKATLSIAILAVARLALANPYCLLTAVKYESRNEIVWTYELRVKQQIRAPGRPKEPLLQGI